MLDRHRRPRPAPRLLLQLAPKMWRPTGAGFSFRALALHACGVGVAKPARRSHRARSIDDTIYAPPCEQAIYFCVSNFSGGNGWSL